MSAFWQLFTSNLKLVYRNTTALFWTLVMPTGLYVALSVLPLPEIIPNINYSSYVLPGMIAYTITTNGIYGLAYWMAEMRSKNVIKRFLVTPIKVRDLALALVASRLVVMFLQVTVITLAGVLLFDAPFAGNYINVIVFTILGGTIFLCIGLLIANYASSYETATPLTTAVGMPMMFLGNIFFPTETLPNFLRQIGQVLPITFLADGMRQSYLYAFDFSKISSDLLWLFVWLVIMLTLTIKIFKLKE
jgi:ABC-2 type transport system permease protein